MALLADCFAHRRAKILFVLSILSKLVRHAFSEKTAEMSSYLFPVIELVRPDEWAAGVF